MGTAGRAFAQAKVNLALRILGRNDDGYHSIETAFLRLELADTVTVRVTEGPRSLSCDAMAADNSEDNRAFRAAAESLAPRAPPNRRAAARALTPGEASRWPCLGL